MGESWKSLPREEKEILETQAQRAKEKYSFEPAKYKKTPEYQKYSRYLQEFKKKHQKSGKGQGEDTQRKVEANSPLEQSMLVAGNDAWRRQGQGPGQSHCGGILVDDATHRSGRSSISVGSNETGGGSAYTTRGTSPSSSRPCRSGSFDTSVECLSSTGSWVITPGNDAVVNNVPLSPHATTGTGSPGKEVPAPRHIETANPQALPPLSDIIDSRMTSPRLDRVDLGPQLGGRYNRNGTWGLAATMPTTGPSAMRRGTWPNTRGSLELYGTGAGPKRDTEFPIRPLPSNNLAPPMYQWALCVSKNCD